MNSHSVNRRRRFPDKKATDSVHLLSATPPTLSETASDWSGNASNSGSNKKKSVFNSPLPRLLTNTNNNKNSKLMVDDNIGRTSSSSSVRTNCYNNTKSSTQSSSNELSNSTSPYNQIDKRREEDVGNTAKSKASPTATPDKYYTPPRSSNRYHMYDERDSKQQSIDSNNAIYDGNLSDDYFVSDSDLDYTPDYEDSYEEEYDDDDNDDPTNYSRNGVHDEVLQYIKRSLTRSMAESNVAIHKNVLVGNFDADLFFPQLNLILNVVAVKVMPHDDDDVDEDDYEEHNETLLVEKYVTQRNRRLTVVDVVFDDRDKRKSLGEILKYINTKTQVNDRSGSRHRKM